MKLKHSELEKNNQLDNIKEEKRKL